MAGEGAEQRKRETEKKREKVLKVLGDLRYAERGAVVALECVASG